MRIPFTICCIICLIPFLTCQSSAPSRHPSYNYICIYHNKHHLNNKEEMAKCYGLSAKELDTCYRFSESNPTDSEDNIKRTAEETRDAVENKIVDYIVNRLKRKMGKEFYKNWTYDKMEIPAIFRDFVARDNKRYFIKTVAVIKKSDLSDYALINYLPLEYKMHFLEKDKK